VSAEDPGFDNPRREFDRSAIDEPGEGTPLACPSCGSADDLREIQSIEGMQNVRVTLREPNADPDCEFGATEMLWETVSTTGVRCRACDWEYIDEHWVFQLVPSKAHGDVLGS
jgi:hypothetical protein